MKICILCNLLKDSRQKELLLDISNILKEHDLVIIDFSKCAPLHTFYFEIENANPDAIISIDFSGFELRSECNDLSLNRLGCRMLFLVNDIIEKYKKYLELQLNFSMFLFLDAFNNSDELLRGRDNIPNYELVNYKDESGNVEYLMLKSVILKFFDLARLKIE